MLCFNCPRCGKSFKVKDEQTLSDPNLVKDGRVISKLLESCWLETIDPGPYPFLANGEESFKKPGWDRVLQGDRLFTLVCIRVKTYGPDYEFDIQCSNSSCERTIQWRMDLQELECNDLPPESRQKVKADEPFLTELADGTQLKYRLLTGVDDRFQARLKETNPSKILLTMLARRVVEIDGVGKDARKIRAFLEDLPLSDADRLRDELEEADCGLQTEFDVYCTVWATISRCCSL